MDYNKNVFKNVFKDIKSNITYMQNNNIVYDNMTSKTVKSNIEILKALTKDVKNPDLKRKANKLVKDYSERINEILIEKKKEKENQKQQIKYRNMLKIRLN